jgi:hypothetical protein
MEGVPATGDYLHSPWCVLPLEELLGDPLRPLCAGWLRGMIWFGGCPFILRRGQDPLALRVWCTLRAPASSRAPFQKRVLDCVPWMGIWSARSGTGEKSLRGDYFASGSPGALQAT